MANHCASLDSTWAHHLFAPLPTPWGHHPAWLSPAAASFEDGALTAALRVSMSSSSPSPSYCSAASPTPSTSTTTTSSASDVLAPAPASVPEAARRGPAGPTGRVAKRKKPRVSRRAPTTYINADPANFRRMVQEVTGFPVPAADPAFAATVSSPSPAHLPAALPYALPTLDTSAFLLNTTPPQNQEKTTSRTPTMFTAPAAAAAAAADESSATSLLMRELEAMVSAPAMACAYPTLESWGMI